MLPLPTHRPRGADGMLCSPGITIIINIIIVIIITVGMILLADANDDDEVPVGEYAEKEKERLEAS